MRLSRRSAVQFAQVATLCASSSLISLSGGAPQALAAPIDTCSSDAGVVVVVDFTRLGGHLERACAPDPMSAYQALGTAGFTTAGDSLSGDAFVCRIDGLPDPTQTPCTSTPPASAFWTFWYARASTTSWHYSSVGAMTSHPTGGTIDAWVFGPSTEPPSFSVNSVRASTSIVSTSTRPVATTTSTTLGATSQTNSATTGALDHTARPAPKGSVVASAHQRSPVGSGSTLGLIVGAIFVVTLSMLAWIATRRRRRSL